MGGFVTGRVTRAGNVIGADNGLSLAAGLAELGQAVGDPGNPAVLLSNREIPSAGSSIGISGAASLGIGIAVPTEELHVANAGTATVLVDALNAVVDVRGAGTSQLIFQAGGLIRTSIMNFDIEQTSTMGVVGSYYWLKFYNPNHAQVSGIGNGVMVDNSFLPTSGNAQFNMFIVSGVVDQTGGANGRTAGIVVDPALVNAPDFNGVEIRNTIGRGIFQSGAAVPNTFNGTLQVGTGTIDAASALQVNSTTQGVRFPNMTQAQRDAIGAPGGGLTIYNTDTGKLNVFGAATWEEIQSV